MGFQPSPLQTTFGLRVWTRHIGVAGSQGVRKQIQGCENRMLALVPPNPGWHRGLLRWPPYFPRPPGRCESRRRDRRHHVFTLNTSRNRHSMAPLAENVPCPQKRNVQSTWGVPRHMGGVRQAAQCLYDAAEPSWAMVRCISSSHSSPILYTACVSLLELLIFSQIINYR